MGFDHRKLLPANLSEETLCKDNCNPVANKEGFCIPLCFKTCPNVCKNLIILPPSILPYPPPPPSPPPPPPPPPPFSGLVNVKLPYNEKHLTGSNIILMACLIGASLLLTFVYLTVRSYWRENNNNSRRRDPPVLFDTRENFLDEDHGPVLDHPIWYIHTVGLPQAVIESITVCKYKKDEGLIEGTDCSVCLSEFEEDESLRLLPKCSHAFHIPCIDTWLRSHKNCPLCRAPIVCDIASSVQVSVPEPILSDSGSRDSIRVENLESNGGGVGNHHVGRGASEVGVTDDDSVYAIGIDGRNAENPRKVLPNSIAVGVCDPRALSDLADNRRVAEQDVQPMRRSFSMDSPSASRIYRAVANVLPEQGSSNSQLVHVKNPNSGFVSKQDSANSSLSKLVRSSSIGLSLQMGSISMKRPFTSSRKLFSSKHGRSLSSVLPL